MMLRIYLVPSNLIWVMSLWVSSYQIGKKLLILLCFWWFFYTICISGSLLLSRSGWCLPLMRNEELGVTRLCQKDWNVLSFCLLGVLFSAHCCLGECFVFHFAFVCTSSSTYEIIFIYHQEELLLWLAYMVSDFLTIQEIFSSRTHKIDHFQMIHTRTGIPFNSMLFFDDENRNIQSVKTKLYCFPCLLILWVGSLNLVFLL
jgi:hypothetical protein